MWHTQLCVLKDGYVVQFRVFYFPATCTDLCVLSRLWMLKCRNHHRQHFDLPQVINTGGGNTLLPGDMMRQWHLCLPCYYHTGYDAMWKGRGAAHKQAGKSIPRTHLSRRLAGQSDATAPTPIDRGCPEWDTLLVPWTSSRCEVRSLCSKG